jgi:multidrug efflux pump subunit AcrA (membrane-fusion protein)
MKKYIFVLCLGLLGMMIILSGTSCRDSSHKQNSDETGADVDPENNSIPGKITVPGQGSQSSRDSGITRGYGRTGKGLGRSRGITLKEEEKEMVKIQTAQAEYRSIKDSFSAPGKVMAHRHRKAIVSYAFPARIADIHVRIGDWVNAGDKLVTVQSEEVGNAKSEFYKSLADFELAQVNCEREQRLVERGVGAKKNLLAAESDLKVAQANLTAAEKKLHVLGFTEAQVDDIRETHQINPIITLFAPIRAKIIENNAILGQMVDQSNEILVLLDPPLSCASTRISMKRISPASAWGNGWKSRSRLFRKKNSRAKSSLSVMS